MGLLSGLLLCRGRCTISRAIQAAGLADEKHHSSIYRFLSEGRWLPDELGRVLFRLLLPRLGEEVLAVVDDTLCRKGGPHIWGGGMHHDASNSTIGLHTEAARQVRFAFGHNWVILGVWVPLPWGEDRGVAVPVLFRLYRQKSRCPATRYQKRTELASELVKIFSSWIPADRALHVTADSEYSSRTVVRPLPKGVRFTGSMPMDAALYDQPGPYRGKGRPRTKGRRLSAPKEFAAANTPWERVKVTIYGRPVQLLVKTRVCLWYTAALGRPVRIVVTRDPRGRLQDRAYFSTETELSPSEILTRYSRRWTMEVTFRDAKQFLGIADPQNGWWRRKHGTRRSKPKAGPNPLRNRGKGAVERTLPLWLLAYGVTVAWYLAHGDPAADVAYARARAPWYRHKRTPSFRDMLGALRRELFKARLLGEAHQEAASSESLAALIAWVTAA